MRIQGQSGPHSKTLLMPGWWAENRRGEERKDKRKEKGKGEGGGKPASYLNQLVKPICKR